MNPTLIVGDYIVVNKNYYKNNDPEYGDLVVFKTPTDNRTDYIKRLIGLPDDTIQFINGDVYLNDNQILKTKIKSYKKIYCGNAILETKTFEEKLPNSKKYIAVYSKNNSFQNSDKFKVPKDHYFFLGDNRDCSKDSRFLSAVGYVPRKNILHKLYMIYWSGDKSRIGLFPK
jgi:signal peptidase I